ncbi:FAD-dependent oxidoreductase [Caulobacter sp. 1776]|uniref:FAD-dependent oxidoreductase n=1 Tax=Caulobacter sp. 1776 TaxID=3156420 RepID=UPI0033972064
MTYALTTDVLICGAGAAGLTLAIDLARRGVDFMLIDKADGPFHGSRGKGIQPRSVEVFEDLGVLDGLLAAGAAPYPTIRAYAGQTFTDTQLGEDAQPTPAEPWARPLMSPQFLTERALRDRLAVLGHAPRFGTALAGFVQDAEGVTATLDSGQTIRARWMIGADGGRSFVRPALGVDFPGETKPGRGLVADVRLIGLARDVWHNFTGPDGQRISFCPLAGTDLFQLQGHAPDTADVSLVALDALTRQRTGRDDIVVTEVLWASTFGVNARLAERYRVGRVLLAGDAAHVHPPTGGQGLNTSLQDAYNLGWKLAAVLAGAPEALIDTYEAERRPIAGEVLGLSTRLLAKGDLKRGREARQLDLGYPDSPLSLDLGVAAKVAPGDRAPDAPCRDRDDKAARVFEVLAGPHWTLLGAKTAIAPRPGLIVADLVDANGWFADAYGLPPTGFVLVRPDGYVATVGKTGDEAAVEAYLAKVGL